MDQNENSWKLWAHIKICLVERNEIIRNTWNNQIWIFAFILFHFWHSRNHPNCYSDLIGDRSELRRLIFLFKTIHREHILLKNVVPYYRKYLNQMFYNLTTISMHDWRTYAQMRTMCKQKFNLITVEDHLPTQTIEQGPCDVLEIMRHIHLFVSTYVIFNIWILIFLQLRVLFQFINLFIKL